MNFTRVSIGFSHCFHAQLAYIETPGLHIMKQGFQTQHRDEGTQT